MSVTDTADPWDQPSTSNRIASHRAPVQSVPDDWDDSEEDEDNQKIWENACVFVSFSFFRLPSLALMTTILHPILIGFKTCSNVKAPMPELVISPSSTSNSGQTSLPRAAFQTPIRILKRSPNGTANGNATSGASSPAQASFAEREARYHAARERIFADVGPRSGDDSNQPAVNRIPGAVMTVVRNPRGPALDVSENAAAEQPVRGFSVRGRGRERGMGRRKDSKGGPGMANGATTDVATQESAR